MKFGGGKSNEPYDPVGPQGYSPGTIRNTLGSELKARGFFQKDGKVKNLRGGFIGPKQQTFPGGESFRQAPLSASESGYTQEQGYDQSMLNNNGYNNGYIQGGYGQLRQLILQPAQEGIYGNGAATISPDNSFLLVANLPAPQAFLGQGQSGVYAAYLVDSKGKTGFLAGLLRPVGNGVYRAHFQSPVPLHYYSRVVVSVENPTRLSQAPNGPIILKVKEPMGVMAFIAPVRNTASTVWGKISGLFSGRQKAPVSPEAVPLNQELMQTMNPAEGMAEMTGQPMPQMPQMPPVPPVPPVSSASPPPPPSSVS